MDSLRRVEMHRFFVPPESIRQHTVGISGPLARQIARVLRQRPGDTIIVLDDTGAEFQVVLSEVHRDFVEGRVVERRTGAGEPRVKITLYQAPLKSDRFEFVLQKATELGVSSFVPLLTDRVVARKSNERRSGARVGRWRRIVTEAAEQCGRSRIPTISGPVTLKEACDDAPRAALMPWEEERTSSGVRAALARSRAEGWDGSEVAIFIGPEGGFTAQEAELARALGVQTLSLGQRILRSETAAIATIAAVCHELGELGA
jgi:16S rRNA (uracil1498-N3)-methyltransferase